MNFFDLHDDGLFALPFFMLCFSLLSGRSGSWQRFSNDGKLTSTDWLTCMPPDMIRPEYKIYMETENELSGPNPFGGGTILYNSILD